MKTDLKDVFSALREFNAQRDWDQFHDGKNLALALSIEAAELNELFLWKNAEDVNREKIQEELADVFNYAIMLADKYNLEIPDICLKKIEENSQKYPVDKARGNAKKYSEL